ncbi:hypothetical protein GCM10008090_35220 [Arenicella chitinivorans]|uniref:Uncharacterized protein n=1 Tax=Arenicella chitinivorans TaxID=1329800 RepID=A0A918VTW3_9GAMM|nr:hypothetical protein GCM10008090_35220 [Arenicella chitinivorans]
MKQLLQFTFVYLPLIVLVGLVWSLNFKKIGQPIITKTWLFTAVLALIFFSTVHFILLMGYTIDETFTIEEIKALRKFRINTLCCIFITYSLMSFRGKYLNDN